MLASNRRPCAVRRFPPGCGRPRNAAAGPPPYHQLPTTATAAAETKPALPNPSARAATNAAPPPARRTLPATASSGAEAPVRNGWAAKAMTVPRVSAVRRYPPGCGRPQNAAAGPPPYHQLPTAAAAAETKPTVPNPSARAATNAAPSPAGRTLPATASSAAEAPKAAAAVTVPRVSAFRRYPPGCGRSVALSKSKPPDSESEDGAGKPSAVVGNGDAKARACDGKVMLRLASALDGAEFNSNGGIANGGDGEAGAQEEGGGKPWEVSGLMAVPFLPWAQHERRSQRAKSPDSESEDGAGKLSAVVGNGSIYDW